MNMIISFKYPTTLAQVLDMSTEQCENHHQNQDRNPRDELLDKQKAKTECNILIRPHFPTHTDYTFVYAPDGLHGTQHVLRNPGAYRNDTSVG